MGNVVDTLEALSLLGLDDPLMFGRSQQVIGVGSATAASPPVPAFPTGSFEHTLKFSLTEAVTIGAPTGQTPVAFVSKLRIFITDLAGATAIGFNAIYKAAAINAGAGGGKMYLEFVFDGTNWVQVNVTGTAGSAAENKWL